MTSIVEISNDILSERISLVGSFAIPRDGSGQIYRDALTFAIKRTERNLGVGVTLVGGQPKILDGPGIIFINATAFQKISTELILGLGITFIGRGDSRFEIDVRVLGLNPPD